MQYKYTVSGILFSLTEGGNSAISDMNELWGYYAE